MHGNREEAARGMPDAEEAGNVPASSGGRKAGRRRAPTGRAGTPERSRVIVWAAAQRASDSHRPDDGAATRCRSRAESQREQRTSTGKGSILDIIISNASDKPIYEQIVSQMKALILSGGLDEGQQLPSIRTLASDLRISVITTKRAYAELEAQGFIETVQGKGSFVAGGNKELLREERLRAIEGLLVQAADEARAANVTVQELHDMLALIAESDDR